MSDPLASLQPELRHNYFDPPPAKIPPLPYQKKGQQRKGTYMLWHLFCEISSRRRDLQAVSFPAALAATPVLCSLLGFLKRKESGGAGRRIQEIAASQSISLFLSLNLPLSRFPGRQ